MKPKKIQIIKNTLSVEWNDNSTDNIDINILRKNCPCAVCTSQPDGSDEMRVRRFTKEQLQIASISVTGNYALNIIWKDGHNTGIYEFNLLKKLSQFQTV